MTVPTLPPRGSSDWYAHYAALDTEARKVAAKIDAATAAADLAANSTSDRARANHTGEQAQSTVTSLVADLAAKAPTASPTFTGTVSGVTKTHVGLGNVDNTSDAAKPISTATQTALDFKQAKVRTITTQAGTAYTLVLSDAATTVETNNAAVNTLTVPPNSEVAFPVGTVVRLVQYGAGQTTVAAGAGVTIRSPGAALKLSGQYAQATLVKRGTDEWILGGNVVV